MIANDSQKANPASIHLWKHYALIAFLLVAAGDAIVVAKKL
jgi:hypothetical protein